MNEIVLNKSNKEHMYVIYYGIVETIYMPTHSCSIFY